MGTVHSAASNGCKSARRRDVCWIHDAVKIGVQEECRAQPLLACVHCNLRVRSTEQSSATAKTTNSVAQWHALSKLTCIRTGNWLSRTSARPHPVQRRVEGGPRPALQQVAHVDDDHVRRAGHIVPDAIMHDLHVVALLMPEAVCDHSLASQGRTHCILVALVVMLHDSAW